MALLELTENTPAQRVYSGLRWLVVAAVLIAVPYIAHTPARIDQFTQVGGYAVALVGLNLVIGYAGQISLGHSAFVGLGAYITVILVANHHWSYLSTIPVVLVVCFLVGAVLGLPALRISGLYMAVVTLAIAAIFPVVILKYDGLTGGANGLLAKDKMIPPSWTPFDARSRFGPVAYRYFVVLTVAVVMFVLAHNVVRGRIGRAIIALRDNSTGAAVSGVNLGVARIVMFGISAALGGVGGALLMIQLPQATADRFGLDLAIFLVVALFAGGTGTLSGAVPGALIYIFLPYFAIQWGAKVSFLKGPGAASISGVIYGILLLVFVFVMPGGVADGLRRAWARIVHVTPNPRWLIRHRKAATDAEQGAQHPTDAEPVAQRPIDPPQRVTTTTNHQPPLQSLGESQR